MMELDWNRCILFLCVIAGVSCSRLTIYPRRAEVRPGDNLHVTCRGPSGVPMEECKFFVTGMPSIDLSRGRDSEATDAYRYYGRGLQTGQCGINLLQIAQDCSDLSKIVTVTCAAKLENLGWSVNYMSVLISNARTFPMTVEHEKFVVQPESNVSILCSAAGVPLSSCVFQGKNLGKIDLSHGNPPRVVGGSDVAGRVHYFGQGLPEGDCGITLTGVKEDWNGLVWCAAKSEFGNWAYDFTALIVAKPPSTPTLRVSSSDLKLGESMEATCTVKNFRPSVSIFWEPPFDEGMRIMYNDDLFDVKLDFEEQTVSQRIEKVVTETDHMRTVRCTVKFDENKHEAVAQQQVQVRFCGKRNLKGAKPLVYGGVVAKSGEFPWHVALYRKLNNTYICGGSLISSKHFITAAHCVWNKSFTRPEVHSAFEAALGKFHRKWEQDEHAQRFAVSSVLSHPRYRDSVRNYEDDIAILKLEGTAVFSVQVHPICMDWDLAFEDSVLVNGNLGIIPGWGWTELEDLSDTLRYVDLPYLDDEQCKNVVPQEFLRYLAPAKFCGGYKNQSIAVCGGDSGGGMAFYQNVTRQYYLMGLVSLAPKATATNCNHEQIATFTKISDYLTWIRTELNKDNPIYVRHSTV